MTTQPEALRLAAALSEKPDSDGHCIQAAAELRRLSAIEQAAQNLVKVKGRFHTEQAYNKLKDLLK